MTAIPLSVCIITYNEEDNIQGALETVKWADDIVVIDAHSTDRTVEIARAIRSACSCAIGRVLWRRKLCYGADAS